MLLLSVLFATRGLQNRKHFLFLFLLSRVCSQKCQIRKQSRESVLGFVSIFGVLVNKCGNRFTLM